MSIKVLRCATGLEVWSDLLEIGVNPPSDTVKRWLLVGGTTPSREIGSYTDSSFCISVGNDQVTQLHISFWGYSINQIKGLTVDPSDGTIYFATLTAIYKMAAAWLSPVVLVSGNSQSSGYTDSTLSASRFAGIEVRPTTWIDDYPSK